MAIAIASTFLSPSVQEDFNRGVSYVAKDFDVKVLTKLSMGNGSLTSNVISFDITDMQADHVMPFEWRLKQFVARLLSVLSGANFKVGLQPASTFGFPITAQLVPPTPDEVMGVVQYNIKIMTTSGDVMGAYFSLGVEAP